MRIVQVEQNTAQWLHERVGRITASRVAEAMSKYKPLEPRKDGKPRKNDRSAAETAERRVYRIDLVSERLSGRTTENFNSPEMQWGRDHEDDARMAYELHAGVLVERVGFILHPTVDFIGASPDGLVGVDGGVEIKCPKTETHVRWMLEGVVPEEHIPQIDCNLLCSGRQWWDFVSYDPRLEEKGLDIFVVRRFRDEAAIAALETEAFRMHEDVERTIEELMKRSTGISKQRKVTHSDKVDAPPMEDWASEFEKFIQGEIVP